MQRDDGWNDDRALDAESKVAGPGDMQQLNDVLPVRRRLQIDGIN